MHIWKCSAATVPLPSRSPGGSREEGREEEKEDSSRGGAVPADPSADLLLGHCRENIYMSVGDKLTYKCELLDIIWGSYK